MNYTFIYYKFIASFLVFHNKFKKFKRSCKITFIYRGSHFMIYPRKSSKLYIITKKIFYINLVF